MEPVIIQGNFQPSARSRALQVSARVLSLLFAVLVVAALVEYGLKVHYEDDINRLAKTTREMNEHNKELQVKLNHIRSFKNVEAAAAKVPHLHLAETIIDVPTPRHVTLPPIPQSKREFPAVYGY